MDHHLFATRQRSLTFLPSNNGLAKDRGKHRKDKDWCRLQKLLGVFEVLDDFGRLPGKVFS